MLVNKESSW